MKLQVGVKAVLRNSEGKILLMKINAEKYPEVGAKWDIAGGRIDPGSTLLENLKREVKEETNLVMKGEPKLLAAQDILRVEGKHVVRLTYTVEAEGEVVLDEEHTEFKWFTLDEIRAMSEDDLDIYFKELLDQKLVY